MISGHLQLSARRTDGIESRLTQARAVSKSALPLLLAAATLLSVSGAFQLGPLTMSAAGSVVLTAVFGVADLQRRTVLAPSAAWVVLALFAMVAIMIASGLGQPTSIAAAQQAVVWGGTAFAVVFGHNISRRHDNLSLDTSITKALGRTAAAIVVVTGVDAFVFPVDPIAPRIAALGALVPLAWFVSRWQGYRSASGLISIGLCVFIGATLSRTAFVTAVAMVVVGPLTKRGVLSGHILLRGALAVTALFLVATRWAPLRNRFFAGDQSLSVGGFDINSSGRTTVWRGLWARVGEQPLVGHGLGSARAETSIIAPGIGHPHQEFLRVLYEGGAITLTLLLVTLAVPLVAMARPAGRASDPLARQFCNAALLMTVAVAMTALTDNTLVYPFMMFPFGLLLGLGYRARPRALSTDN